MRKSLSLKAITNDENIKMNNNNNNSKRDLLN